MEMQKPKVVFSEITAPKEKLEWLAKVVYRAFAEQKKIYVYVENLKVAQFVDHFLWEYPKNSFLPHSIEDAPCTSAIAIGWLGENLNQAEHLVNLSKKAPFGQGFLSVDEFFDVSMLEAVELKKNTYLSAGYRVEGCPLLEKTIA